jgi:hypothetical protein
MWQWIFWKDALKLFSDGAVQCFKDNRDKVMTFGAFDLFKGLDVLMLGAVHNRQDFSYKMGFIARPLTARTRIKRFHKTLLHLSEVW